MAISRNAVLSVAGKGRALDLGAGIGEPVGRPAAPAPPPKPAAQPPAAPPRSAPATPPTASPVTGGTIIAAPPPRLPVATPPVAPPSTVGTLPVTTTFPPVSLPPGGIIIDRFPPILTLPPQDFQIKTTTQLAQGALNLLKTASVAVVREAIATMANKKVAAADLIHYLERKVFIAEVLNELARDWKEVTRQDFAEAFQMANNKLDVMDAIVSIAILNDPDLVDELSRENVSDATGADLLDNRRVVAQYPPAGTPLEAPYLVLVAVEYRDTRQADEVIQSITGDLVDQQGYKIPRSVAQNLR